MARHHVERRESGPVISHTGTVMMLPLFPLPTVVLFPGVLLPLHIFEPRYRAMVTDALESDRRIAMVLLQPGWKADYEGRPPIFDIGCSAVIVHSARLDDGRFNVVLHGLDRVRILAEDQTRPYRLGRIEVVPDAPPAANETETMRGLRAQLITHLGAAYTDPLPAMPDAELVHTIAQSFDFEPLEKQALLEERTLATRTASLLNLLEMKRLSAGMPGGSSVTH